MRKISVWAGLAVAGCGAFWFLTMPETASDADFAGITGDSTRGQVVFTAAGCASCHMADGATGDAKLLLTGGQKFPSDFGTFVAPNISPDPVAGIGGWSVTDLASALWHGTSPKGAHYYPALPYWSYSRMTAQDMADLHSYLMTLPSVAEPAPPHEVGFPFNIRRLLGGWKLLNTPPEWVVTGDLTAEEERGRYIAEGLAHCAECHTPRNAVGGLVLSDWLSGAPNPSGGGTVPNITPAALTWTGDEVLEYLTSGFTPDFDSVGGHMAHVVENMAALPEGDRRAVVAYLAKVAPVESAAP